VAYKRQKQYRLPGHDYAQAGEYFITICTKDRECFLGEIQQGAMVLLEAGKIAQTHLLEIPERFGNVVLNEWVIMPNHIHMILIIVGDRRNMINHVPTVKTNKSGIPNNPMEMPDDTIGKMIRWYKGRVSYECRKPGLVFKWQDRFHDHIIRDRRSLENIRRYVQDNPLRWEEDIFNVGSGAHREKFGSHPDKYLSPPR
jgi:REP element-mobilizing transposase RayT